MLGTSTPASSNTPRSRAEHRGPAVAAEGVSGPGISLLPKMPARSAPSLPARVNAATAGAARHRATAHCASLHTGLTLPKGKFAQKRPTRISLGSGSERRRQRRGAGGERRNVAAGISRVVQPFNGVINGTFFKRSSRASAFRLVAHGRAADDLGPPEPAHRGARRAVGRARYQLTIWRRSGVANRSDFALRLTRASRRSYTAALFGLTLFFSAREVEHGTSFSFSRRSTGVHRFRWSSTVSC